MHLLTKDGRERPICRECALKQKAAHHRQENCPVERKRRQRERRKNEVWLAQMMGLRDAIIAERTARQA
jgi:hypothetical protein